MRSLFDVMGKLRNDTRGVTAIEYGFICLLIFLVIITGITAIGTQLATIFGLAAAGF